MIRYHYLLLCISISTSSYSQIIGERIDGPANVRTEPNGELVFTLNDRILIEAGPKINDWHEISVTFNIPFAQKDSFLLTPGKPIIDMEGDTIGWIHSKAETSVGWTTDKAWLSLYGYTHHCNIRNESVVENHVNQNLKDSKFDFLEWREIIESFEFVEWNEINGYNGYYIYESIEPSPRWRVLLLFRNFDLVGIVHTRPLKENTYMKDYQVDESYNVMFVKNYPEAKIKQFIIAINEWLDGVN